MATTGKGLPRSMAKAAKAETLKLGTSATDAMPGNKKPTATQRGGLLLQPAIADLTAAPTKENFNALLAALRAAGVLTP